MPWLKLFKKLVKALESNASPDELAGGFVLGMIVGLTPFFSLVNVAVLILMFILNVNVAMVFIAAPLFGLIGLLTDRLAHPIGRALLTSDALAPLWTRLYNMPVVPLSRFNNTVVLGNLVIAAVLLVPVFFLWRAFVEYYRKNLAEKVRKSKFMKLIGFGNLFNVADRFKPQP